MLSGRPLAVVNLAGVDGYEFTASFVAWAAQQDVTGSGALGPVQAFGLEAFEEGAGGGTRAAALGRRLLLGEGVVCPRGSALGARSRESDYARSSRLTVVFRQ